MSDNYGMKTTITTVVNGDDYTLGLTYTDTNGTDVDKQLSGSLDTFDKDLFSAVGDLAIDVMKNLKTSDEKEVPSEEAQEETVQTSTPVEADESRIAALERENRKLNEKIDRLLARDSYAAQSRKTYAPLLNYLKWYC